MTCGANGTSACKIGTKGPGGGWIFFVDYNDQFSGFDYLEAAPTGALRKTVEQVLGTYFLVLGTRATLQKVQVCQFARYELFKV